MRTSDFYFDLPEDLIAQKPVAKRGESRMLVLDAPPSSSSNIEHCSIQDIVKLIPAGTVMVVNNSKVRRARLQARTAHGGAVEILLLQHLSNTRWSAILSRSKRRKSNEILDLPGSMQATVIERDENQNWILEFSPSLDDEYLETYGSLPLPPYIKRVQQDFDLERYQTVYAQHSGSAAAPTAGLHFTDAILDDLRRKGVEIHTITLHVGLGTFLPVRTEFINEHRMHREDYCISAETAAAVNNAKTEGRPILAVGTTSVRALESSWSGSSLNAGESSTNIFIYPGKKFQLVDILLTNFHTPESTLLMLVSAFAGSTDRILSAYALAIQERYRFFSYGDAMLINRWSRPLLQSLPELAVNAPDGDQ